MGSMGNSGKCRVVGIQEDEGGRGGKGAGLFENDYYCGTGGVGSKTFTSNRKKNKKLSNSCEKNL
jgi:hypothetical protein